MSEFLDKIDPSETCLSTMDAQRLRALAAEGRVREAREAEQMRKEDTFEYERAVTRKAWAASLSPEELVKELIPILKGNVEMAAKRGATSHLLWQNPYEHFGFCCCGDYMCESPPPLTKRLYDLLTDALLATFDGCTVERTPGFVENEGDVCEYLNVSWA